MKISLCVEDGVVAGADAQLRSASRTRPGGVVEALVAEVVNVPLQAQAASRAGGTASPRRSSSGRPRRGAGGPSGRDTQHLHHRRLDGRRTATSSVVLAVVVLAVVVRGVVVRGVDVVGGVVGGVVTGDAGGGRDVVRAVVRRVGGLERALER